MLMDGAVFSHDGTVRGAVFSPDGLRVLTASNDKTARLWNRDGSQIEVLRHGDVVNQAVFSGDGNSILTVSDDTTARLWASRWEPDQSPPRTR